MPLKQERIEKRIKGKRDNPSNRPYFQRNPLKLFLAMVPSASADIREIREFKNDVYGRRQTAKITSDYIFSSCNPSKNHT